MTPRASRRPRAAASARTGPAPAALVRLAVALAVAIGVVYAARLSWTSDDAYISFRYARNLVRGLGLVYNAGERVEGYSNFLWTLWSALGFRLGQAPEPWVNVSSIACYAATLLLLGLYTMRRVRRGPSPPAGAAALVWATPWAALIGAVHRDWAGFATSGLETAEFTLAVTASFLGVVWTADAVRDARDSGRGNEWRWAAVSGVLLASTCLSRPDGFLFALMGGAAIVWITRRRPVTLAAFVVPLAAIVAPYALWKLRYYGDLRPNTYYAKSADRAWWSQGAYYVALYFQRYWPLAPPAGAALWLGATRGRVRGWEPTLLALGLGLGFTIYVMWVGGDFMFARFLLPVTPLYAIVLEDGLAAWGARPLDGGPARGQPDWAIAVGIIAVLGVALTPSPIGGDRKRGIVDERTIYAGATFRETEHAAAEQLRQLFAGLPVRISLPGGKAMMGFISDAPVAIEAETGLTDRYIAHQRLAERGRIGHEKHAPYAYLIETRRVHLMLNSEEVEDSLRPYVPIVPLRYGQASGYALTWDPVVMNELRRRGAEIPDPAADMDDLIARMDTLSDAVVRRIYVKARRFYFDNVHDPVRQGAIERRLSRPATPRPRPPA